MNKLNIPEDRSQPPGPRYWEMKEALCEIMDLINEVIPTDVSEDHQYKFPAENAVKRVKELIAQSKTNITLKIYGGSHALEVTPEGRLTLINGDN